MSEKPGIQPGELVSVLENAKGGVYSTGTRRVLCSGGLQFLVLIGFRFPASVVPGSLQGLGPVSCARQAVGFD